MVLACNWHECLCVHPRATMRSRVGPCWLLARWCRHVTTSKVLGIPKQEQHRHRDYREQCRHAAKVSQPYPQLTTIHANIFFSVVSIGVCFEFVLLICGVFEWVAVLLSKICRFTKFDLNKIKLVIINN